MPWQRGKPRTPGEQAGRYDSAEHRAARAAYRRLVDSGHAYCWRCGKHIPPGTEVHVGHSDDGTRVMGPEGPDCNRRAAARKGALIANARRKAKKQAQTFIRPIR